MRRIGGLTRKQFLGLAVAASGVIFGRLRPARANRPAVLDREPLIGEPGYEKRMAKLFRL